jgi:amidophosphoribosyltransferase
MVVCDKYRRLHSHKECGLVRDVFKLQHIIRLLGFYGIAHNRYPTAGTSSNVHEAQPFETHIPFGLCIAHNGNLTNTLELQAELQHRYHFNTDR